MKLSPDEDLFLRGWMYDEVHYHEGAGPAKQLQLRHQAIPSDLAVLIAAAIPDPAVQQQLTEEAPPEAPKWPWASPAELQRRVAEARTVLAHKREKQS